MNSVKRLRDEETGTTYTGFDLKTIIGGATAVAGAIATAFFGAQQLTPQEVNPVMSVKGVQEIIKKELEYKSPEEVEIIVEDMIHETRQDTDIELNQERFRDIQDVQAATQMQQMAISGKIDELLERSNNE